jgi:hypothetical protein
MRRDARVDEDDYFELILDTYHDHRSGYYFITNPNGVKRDAVVASEGRDFNPAWDGIWTCETKIHELGWSIEIAIPWKTLRFSESDSSVWGVNFARMIRRKNEHVYWQLIPRDFGGGGGIFRFSEAGNLFGLHDLKMGGNLEMKPYLLAGIENDENTSFNTEGLLDAGLDVKVAITANMVLDLTLNTDFAQVEVDQEQVNLTRFSLYYPEKRDFFLEGAEIFSFGGERRRGRSGSDLHLFYSRRLGLVDGHEARILGGAKMIGKIGSTHLGVMNIITDDVDVIDDEDTTHIHPTNFTVLRIRRDILQRGMIGFMALNKEDLLTSDYNRSYGIDTYLPVNDYFSITGYLAGTFGPEEDEDGQAIDMNKYNVAGKIGLSYNSDLWEFSASYQDIGDRFNPEIGFNRRKDFRYFFASAEYSPRPQNAKVIRQFQYRINGNYRTDHDKNMLDSDVGATFGIRFQNSARFSIGIEREAEFIDEDWEVREGLLIPLGTYIDYGAYLSWRGDESRTITADFNMHYRDYYSGDNLQVSLGSVITKISPMRIELDYRYNYVNLPEGHFQTNTLGLRLLYFFSTELYIKTYLQWNDDKLAQDGNEKIISNILLRWIYSPGSDLYLLYNDGRLLGPRQTEISNRTFMMKLTFLWRK